MPRTYTKKNVRYQYDTNRFMLALEAVANGSSIRWASKYFGVPYTTLNSHVNSEVTYDTIGRPTKFTTDEENHLEQAALVLQKWGVPLTIDEFLNLSKEYASFLNKSNLFPNETPTYDWFYSFLNRHHNLILKKSYPLEKKRASLTIAQVDDWFRLLLEVLQENDLEHRPAQIFNCDESGMSDTIGYSKVIVHRQTSNAYRIATDSGGKSYVTTMFCASATGFLLPPFVIYKAKRLFTEWCVGGPQDTGFETSDNGWMDTTLFRKWFHQMFLEQTKNLPRPLLLILDGHGSHFDVETLKLARENQVIILCLPSNATHILQPLDIVFFSPLKEQWKTILRIEYTRTKFKTINKERFPSLLFELWSKDSAARKTNVVKSFLKAGVFPYNPNAIDRSRILNNNKSINTFSTSSISYTTNDLNNNTQQQQHDLSITNSTSMTNDNSNNMINDSPSSTVGTSSHHLVTPFTSSNQAINTLNQIIHDTEPNVDNDSTDNDDEEDENYAPPKSTSFSSTPAPSNNNQKCVPAKKSTMARKQSVSSNKTNKRKKRTRIVGFDTSDEDDDFTISSQSSESQGSTQKETVVPLEKVSSVKDHQSVSTHQNKKKMKTTSRTINIDIWNEDDEEANQSPPDNQHSLTAITNAIQTVFATSSKETARKPTKRMVLDRSRGQVITEKLVMEQLEERQTKQNSKRSRSTNKGLNETKRRKQDRSIPPDSSNSTITQSSTSRMDSI